MTEPSTNQTPRTWGTLRFRAPDGREVHYHFTDPDRLWLARALWGEGGRPDTVAWAMAQRFALLWPRFQSFGRLLEMYNKSISPRWIATGDRCGPGGRYADDPRHCSTRLEERRARRRRASWLEVPERYRRAAMDFVEGRTPNDVPRAVHFATSALVRRRMGSRYAQREGWEILKDVGGHAFVTTARSRQWSNGEVRITEGLRAERANTEARNSGSTIATRDAQTSERSNAQTLARTSRSRPSAGGNSLTVALWGAGIGALLLGGIALMQRDEEKKKKPQRRRSHG